MNQGKCRNHGHRPRPPTDARSRLHDGKKGKGGSSAGRQKQTMRQSYQPTVLVDTTNLSRDDWLAYRRYGIGGSDAAAILGNR